MYLSKKLYLYGRYYKWDIRVPTSYSLFPTFVLWSSLLSATFLLWCDNNGKLLGNVSVLFLGHPWPLRQLCPSPRLPTWLCCRNALKILQIFPNLLCTLLLFRSYSGTSGRWDWHCFRRSLNELSEERTVFSLWCNAEKKMNNQISGKKSFKKTTVLYACARMFTWGIIR